MTYSLLDTATTRNSLDNWKNSITQTSDSFSEKTNQVLKTWSIFELELDKKYFFKNVFFRIIEYSHYDWSEYFDKYFDEYKNEYYIFEKEWNTINDNYIKILDSYVNNIFEYLKYSLKYEEDIVDILKIIYMEEETDDIAKKLDIKIKNDEKLKNIYSKIKRNKEISVYNNKSKYKNWNNKYFLGSNNHNDFIYPLEEKIQKDTENFFEWIEEDFHYHKWLEKDKYFLENLKKAYILDLNYFYNEIEKIKNNINLNEEESKLDWFLNYDRYIEENDFLKDYYIEKFITYILLKLTKEDIEEIYNILKNKNNKNNIERNIFKELKYIKKYFFYKLSDKQQQIIIKEVEKSKNSFFKKQLLNNFKKSTWKKQSIFDLFKQIKYSYLETNIFTITSTFVSENFLDKIDKKEIKEKNNILYTNINQKNKNNYNLKVIFNDLYRLYKLNYLKKDYINKNKKYRFLLNEQILEIENVKNTFLEDIKEELQQLEKKQNFSNIHIFEKFWIPLLTLYEKEINNDTIYIWWFNSWEKLWLWFKFLKNRIKEIGKEKNIKLFVIDSINWKKKDNSKLIKKYKELGFILQKDKKWNPIKDNWWKNNRNSDFVMIRPKGVKN